MRKNNVVFMNVANEMRGRKQRAGLNLARDLIVDFKIKSARQRKHYPFLSRMNNALSSHMQLHPLHNYAGKGAERMMIQYHKS